MKLSTRYYRYIIHLLFDMSVLGAGIHRMNFPKKCDLFTSFPPLSCILWLVQLVLLSDLQSGKHGAAVRIRTLNR